MADTKIRTDVLHLMCRLTPDEQRVRGIELADAHDALDCLNNQKRALADQIKDAELKIDKLALVVKYCQEERPVECSLTPDLAADTMTTVRTDTGETVSIRQLTAAERRDLQQPELPSGHLLAQARPRLVAHEGS